MSSNADDWYQKLRAEVVDLRLALLKIAEKSKECQKLRAEVVDLRLALLKIAEKSGPFSQDNHQHACNVIDNMALIAERALKGEKWDDLY